MIRGISTGKPSLSMPVFGFQRCDSSFECGGMILCADDYGLAEDIDHSILELVREKRLSAVSCMALLERCTPALMGQLLHYQSTVDVGLHFCLTDEHLPLSKPPIRLGATRELPSFRNLFWRTIRRSVSPAEIEQELARQYDQFLSKAGRAPDFIDGHLHVHQLPAIRTALVQFVLKLPADARPYVRNTSMAPRQLRRRRLPWLKAVLIGSFGTRMKRQLLIAGLKTNDGFSGIYDFRRWERYPEYFPKFLSCLGSSNGILVVHPGQTDLWRNQESATLKAYAFAAGRPAKFCCPPA